MFRWQKEIERLDIPAAQVLHLERSLSAVQVALPGLPSQEATAYLCAYAAGKGLRVAVVLHLHTSSCLAFYLHGRAEVPQAEAGPLIEEGRRFIESMGFILSDVDYRKLGRQEQANLWRSLPLKTGAGASAPVTAASLPAIEKAPVAIIAAQPARPAAVVTAVPAPPPPAEEAVVELADEAPGPPPTPAEAVPHPLPPSGTEMAARLRKPPPSAGELTARRQQLLENVGRFLASR